MNKLGKNFLVKVVVIFSIMMMLLSSVSFGTSLASDIYLNESMDNWNINFILIILIIVLAMMSVTIIRLVSIKVRKNFDDVEKKINKATSHIKLLALLIVVLGIGDLSADISIIYKIILIACILCHIAGTVIICKLYYKNPINAVKLEKIFLIIILVNDLISNCSLAINELVSSIEFGLLGIILPLVFNISWSLFVLLNLYGDAIIVEKAIKLSGKEYEEIDRNKKQQIYLLFLIMIIIYLIRIIYYNYSINETLEYYEAYNEFTEAYNDYLDQYDENDINNDLFDNNYIDDTVIDNNINDYNIINNNVSGDNNTISNEIIYNGNIINNISDTNSVISDNTISNNVTDETVNNTTNLDLPQLEQLVGDVNGDERVSMTDLSLLKGHIVKTKVLEGAQYSAADINADGKVSMTDLSKIKAIIVGM